MAIGIVTYSQGIKKKIDSPFMIFARRSLRPLAVLWRF